MVSHQAVKELILMRQLNHINIAKANNLHYTHRLSDLSRCHAHIKEYSMFVEMDKAEHDLQELTKERDSLVKLSHPQIKCVIN
mmetsp:Transcript_41449/g.63242  ORF Transcript_41449/g.63242 Transcript_41449/m.63242 type:complete len:83 (+) Transcript_41449:946-1194(+)